MYTLRLIKGISYSGGFDGKLKATRDNPECVVQTKEEADMLLSDGFFTLVSVEADSSGEDNPPTDDPPPQAPDFSKMKKSELEDYAESVGADLSKCKNNDERIAAIQAALNDEGKTVTVTGEGSGSLTMIDLQNAE